LAGIEEEKNIAAISEDETGWEEIDRENDDAVDRLFCAFGTDMVADGGVVLELLFEIAIFGRSDAYSIQCRHSVGWYGLKQNFSKKNFGLDDGGGLGDAE